MSGLAEVVEAFLRDDGWPAVAAGDGAWIATVEGEMGQWQMSFEVRRGEVFLVRSHAPLQAPPARRAAVVEYASRATYGLPLGVVEVDIDTGQAAVRTGFDGEDVDHESLVRLVFGAIYANVHLANRYLPGLLAVGLGTSEPRDALPEDEREPDDSPEE